MEQTFGTRLKTYRKAKNMTQQELADLLGVSNKTISRWESDGGYPDIPLLVPLAKALGVTVDDLLNEEKPVRSLTKLDLQSLLSFAFALGGGVLFYLLNQFMPIVLCYLGYLACMAYGVYLQRYYSYQSRWFRLGNGIMNFSVNVSLVTEVGGLLWAIPFTLNADGTGTFGAEILYWLHTHLQLCIGVGIAAVVLLTAAALLLVEKLGLGHKLPEGRPCLRTPGLTELFPALAAVLLTVFWVPYSLSEAVPAVFYRQQTTLWLALSAAFILFSALVSWRKRSVRCGVGTLLLLGEAVVLPILTRGFFCYEAVGTVRFAEAGYALLERWGGQPEKYILFQRPEAGLYVAAILVALVCLLVAVVGWKAKKEPTEQENTEA